MNDISRIARGTMQWNQRKLLGTFLALGILSCPTLGADEIDFNLDVRPILSENCFHCHGPDAESRAANLRLDTQAGSREDLGGYAAVVTGKASESELIARILSDDPDIQMPPPDSKRELTSQQIDILQDWVAGGGDYAEHWAFVSPTRPVVPDGHFVSWTINPIDGFVGQRLQQSGLTPSTQADRRTLIRRVSLDLIGLPPTREEIDAFLNDSSVEAYERLVDRLLASKRFGERWARPWLDLARYADSNGFQADQLRDSWAYRDWVIDSMNRDMPFDQFTIEQLAGDLLPDSTVDQKIATGFHRTVTCNVEAGVHPEENRVNQVIDRVNATSTAWLGMTIECAQCHDHKYDPITQNEYYQLFAVFNNTPLEVENPSGKGVSFNFWGPKMDLPQSEKDARKRRELQGQIASLTKQLKASASNSDRKAWEKELSAALKTPPRWETLSIKSVEASGGEDVVVLDDQSVLVTGTLPDASVYEITCETDLENITGFQIEALTHPKIPGTGPGRGDAKRTNFILSEFDVAVVSPEDDSRESVSLHSATADFSQTKWDVEKAIDGNRKTGWAIAPKFQESHWAKFLVRDPLGSADGLKLQFSLDQNYGRGRTIGRVRLSALVGDAIAIDVPGDVAKSLMKPDKKRTRKDRSAIQKYFETSNPVLQKLNQQITDLSRELDLMAPPTTLVMVEMDEPRETFVMKRGDYLSPGPKVSPGTPAALHPMADGLPRNRLGLAKWIVDPANPLTARVTVNRWWTQLFGHGIVETLEDFGTQSSPPSHPELLDWLAVELIDSGWSMKHILKTMVTSQTYQQDSRVTPGLLENDPANQFYARGPRFRMSAEMIRDNGLSVSGLLATKMKGPPVMPHQPSGLWRQTGRNEPKWINATDADRYRRGVYVVWRRAAPYPSFVNFDGPDRSSCVVSRPRTNTPLQALTLMNDPAYVEMALALAIRIMEECSDENLDDQLSYAFEMVTARRPDADESARLRSVYDERFFHLRNNPKEVEALVADHGFPIKVPGNLPQDELAAWFYVANVLLNLDETITKN